MTNRTKAATVVGAALLAGTAYLVTTSLQSGPWPAPYGPGYVSPECEGKICGFGFQPPDKSCLHENGAAVGPIRCHPLDARYEPFPSYPGKVVPADGEAYKHRYWGQCRQANGVVKGYPPFFTGEPGGNYGPQKMRELCLANAFGTAATHDCQVHNDMGWTVREVYDWNASQIQGAISHPPAWQCFFEGDTPPPTPAPTVTATSPQPTPTATATATTTPPVNPCPPGQCQSMFGCQPCSGVTPTPTATATLPSPTPTPTSTAPKPTPTPCPSCPPVPVRCAEYSAAAMAVFKDIGNGKVSQTVLTQRLIRLRTEMLRKDGCVAVGLP